MPDSLPNLDDKDFRNLLRSTKGIRIFVFYAGRILFYPGSRLSISLFPRETRPFLPLSLSLEQEGSRKVGSDRFFDDNRVNDSSRFPILYPYPSNLLLPRNGCRNSSSSKTWARVSNASCRVTAPPRVRSRARDFSGEKSIEKFDWTDLSLGK